MPAFLEDAEFFHFDITDGAHLHVLWLQPITVAERHIKRLRGAHELDKKLIENHIIFLDIDRPCTVMSESRAQRRARERAQRRRRRGRRDTPWGELTCNECHGTFFDVLSDLGEDDDDAD